MTLVWKLICFILACCFALTEAQLPSPDSCALSGGFLSDLYQSCTANNATSQRDGLLGMLSQCGNTDNPGIISLRLLAASSALMDAASNRTARFSAATGVPVSMQLGSLPAPAPAPPPPPPPVPAVLPQQQQPPSPPGLAGGTDSGGGAAAVEGWDGWLGSAAELGGAAEAGSLLPLDSLVPLDSQLDWSGLTSSVRAAVEYDSQVLALPQQATPLLLLYRRDVLAAAGLAGAVPRTWVQLLAAARRLHGADPLGEGRPLAGVCARWYQGCPGALAPFAYGILAPYLQSETQNLGIHFHLHTSSSTSATTTTNSSSTPTTTTSTTLLAPLLASPAAAEALDLLMQLRQVGWDPTAPSSSSASNSSSSASSGTTTTDGADTAATAAAAGGAAELCGEAVTQGFLQGRCAFSLSTFRDFKAASHSSSPATPLRGHLGAAPAPGSTRVLLRVADSYLLSAASSAALAADDAASSSSSAAAGAAVPASVAASLARAAALPLVNCSRARCPLADSVTKDEYGVDRQVNRAPYIPASLMAVSSLNHSTTTASTAAVTSSAASASSSPLSQLLSYYLLSELASPAAQLQQALDPNTDAAPLRKAHLDPSLWVAAGYDSSDAAAVLAAMQTTLEHANPAYQLRMKEQETYGRIFSELLDSLLAADGRNLTSLLAAAATAAATAFDAATDPSLALSYKRSTKRSSTTTHGSVPPPPPPAALADEGDVGPGGALPSWGVTTVSVVGLFVILAAIVLIVRYGRMIRFRRYKSRTAPGPGPDTTLLLSDIADSTALWEALPADIMDRSVRLHSMAVRHLLLEHRGFESATEGDAFIAAFDSPLAALAFACDLQVVMLRLEWPEELLERPEAAPAYVVPAVALAANRRRRGPPETGVRTSACGSGPGSPEDVSIHAGQSAIDGDCSTRSAFTTSAIPSPALPNVVVVGGGGAYSSSGGGGAYGSVFGNGYGGGYGAVIGIVTERASPAQPPTPGRFSPRSTSLSPPLPYNVSTAAGAAVGGTAAVVAGESAHEVSLASLAANGSASLSDSAPPARGLQAAVGTDHRDWILVPPHSHQHHSQHQHNNQHQQRPHRPQRSLEERRPPQQLQQHRGLLRGRSATIWDPGARQHAASISQHATAPHHHLPNSISDTSPSRAISPVSDGSAATAAVATETHRKSVQSPGGAAPAAAVAAAAAPPPLPQPRGMPRVAWDLRQLALRSASVTGGGLASAAAARSSAASAGLSRLARNASFDGLTLSQMRSWGAAAYEAHGTRNRPGGAGDGGRQGCHRARLARHQSADQSGGCASGGSDGGGDSGGAEATAPASAPPSAAPELDLRRQQRWRADRGSPHTPSLLSLRSRQERHLTAPQQELARSPEQSHSLVLQPPIVGAAAAPPAAFEDPRSHITSISAAGAGDSGGDSGDGGGGSARKWTPAALWPVLTYMDSSNDCTAMDGMTENEEAVRQSSNNDNGESRVRNCRSDRSDGGGATGVAPLAPHHATPTLWLSAPTPTPGPSEIDDPSTSSTSAAAISFAGVNGSSARASHLLFARRSAFAAGQHRSAGGAGSNSSRCRRSSIEAPSTTAAATGFPSRPKTQSASEVLPVLSAVTLAMPATADGSADAAATADVTANIIANSLPGSRQTVTQAAAGAAGRTAMAIPASSTRSTPGAGGGLALRVGSPMQLPSSILGEPMLLSHALTGATAGGRSRSGSTRGGVAYYTGGAGGTGAGALPGSGGLLFRGSGGNTRRPSQLDSGPEGAAPHDGADFLSCTSFGHDRRHNPLHDPQQPLSGSAATVRRTGSGTVVSYMDAGVSYISHMRQLWHPADEGHPDALLVHRGLRLRLGFHTGLLHASEVQHNRATGRAAYSGAFLAVAREVSNAGPGGCVVLSEAARRRLVARGAFKPSNPLGCIYMGHYSGSAPIPDAAVAAAAGAIVTSGGAAGSGGAGGGASDSTNVPSSVAIVGVFATAEADSSTAGGASAAATVNTELLLRGPVSGLALYQLTGGPAEMFTARLVLQGPLSRCGACQLPGSTCAPLRGGGLAVAEVHVQGAAAILAWNHELGAEALQLCLTAMQRLAALRGTAAAASGGGGGGGVGVSSLGSMIYLCTEDDPLTGGVGGAGISGYGGGGGFLATGRLVAVAEDAASLAAWVADVQAIMPRLPWREELLQHEDCTEIAISRTAWPSSGTAGDTSMTPPPTARLPSPLPGAAAAAAGALSVSARLPAVLLASAKARLGLSSSPRRKSSAALSAAPSTALPSELTPPLLYDASGGGRHVGGGGDGGLTSEALSAVLPAGLPRENSWTSSAGVGGNATAEWMVTHGSHTLSATGDWPLRASLDERLPPQAAMGTDSCVATVTAADSASAAPEASFASGAIAAAAQAMPFQKGGASRAMAVLAAAAAANSSRDSSPTGASFSLAHLAMLPAAGSTALLSHSAAKLPGQKPHLQPPPAAVGYGSTSSGGCGAVPPISISGGGGGGSGTVPTRVPSGAASPSDATAPPAALWSRASVGGYTSRPKGRSTITSVAVDSDGHGSGSAAAAASSGFHPLSGSTRQPRPGGNFSRSSLPSMTELSTAAAAVAAVPPPPTAQPSSHVGSGPRLGQQASVSPIVSFVRHLTGGGGGASGGVSSAAVSVESGGRGVCGYDYSVPFGDPQDGGAGGLPQVETGTAGPSPFGTAAALMPPSEVVLLHRGLRLRIGLDVGNLQGTLSKSSGRIIYRGRPQHHAHRLAGHAREGQTMCTAEAVEAALAAAASAAAAAAPAAGTPSAAAAAVAPVDVLRTAATAPPGAFLPGATAAGPGTVPLPARPPSCGAVLETTAAAPPAPAPLQHLQPQQRQLLQPNHIQPQQQQPPATAQSSQRQLPLAAAAAPVPGSPSRATPTAVGAGSGAAGGGGFTQPVQVPVRELLPPTALQQHMPLHAGSRAQSPVPGFPWSPVASPLPQFWAGRMSRVAPQSPVPLLPAGGAGGGGGGGGLLPSGVVELSYHSHVTGSQARMRFQQVPRPGKAHGSTFLVS
ncbi:hypothetical protein Agub_g1545, partial [Astrephomene gubernaculifera]